MKKVWFLLLFQLLFLIIGCAPMKVEYLEEIQANETAFLVPLEGASKDSQGKFMSVDYLKENKIATKRISLPQRWRKTGRGWWSGQWILTSRILKVDRTPITRILTIGKDTGTSTGNQAIWVESLDSIGFGIGINLTAMIKEENAALFLYSYAGRSLADILDGNVRSYISSCLSREFANYNLEKGRSQKNQIITKTNLETTAEFEKYGITITTLGLTEGMKYENEAIQKAIDDKFVAEMQIEIQAQKNLSQAKENERKIDMAKAERLAAEEFARAAEARKKQVDVEIAQILAGAKLEMAKKWDGKLPTNILPSDSPLLNMLQGN